MVKWNEKHLPILGPKLGDGYLLKVLIVDLILCFFLIYKVWLMVTTLLMWFLVNLSIPKNNTRKENPLTTLITTRHIIQFRARTQ